MQGDPTSPSWRKSVLNIPWKDGCWSWNSNTLAMWCEEPTHLRRPWSGKDWRQEEKGMTEDEMAGWHHWLVGHESEWTLEVGDGQGGLACCDSWGRKESEPTEWLNWTELKETKELYTENYKTLMKEIKDDINRWRDRPCSWVGRSILWKWLYYQMQSTDSMWSLSNYQWHFHRIRAKAFTILVETQKTPNSQSSLEKEEWSWRNQPSWFQIILQSSGHQDSMELVQKQKYRPMKQDRKPRNKPMHLWAPYFWQRRQYTTGQRQPLQ